MWLKNTINRYRIERRKERDYNFFLTQCTNLALKDQLNTMAESREKPLVILGNGDSLIKNSEQLDTFGDYMVLNGMVKSPLFYQLKPKYYALADPGFFHDNRAFDGISMTRDILEKTSWPMTLFVPWMHTRNVDWLQSTNYVQIVKVNESNYYGPEEKRQFCYDHNLAMPNVENVLVMCLYIGMCIGYRNILLFGFEHSWTKHLYVNDDNLVCLHDSHFYDDANIQDEIQYHGNGKPFKLHEILRMYADMFAAYWDIQAFAKRKNVRIVNYSPQSFIDAFERGVYE